MKKKGHPPYQKVLFVDTATGYRFVCGSTLQPKEKEVFEGKEYPVYRVPISSKSHPFFTGNQQFVDAEGRVDKFKKRYTNKKLEADKQIEKEKLKTEEMKADKKAKKPAPSVKVIAKKEESVEVEKAEKKAAPKKKAVAKDKES
jgi:large subunit ribosomal protein L31